MSQEKNQHLMTVVTIVSTIMAGTGVYLQWLDHDAKHTEPTIQIAVPTPTNPPQVAAIPESTINQPVPQINNTPVEKISDSTVQTISTPHADMISLKKTEPASSHRDELPELPPLSHDLDMPDMKMGKDDF